MPLFRNAVVAVCVLTAVAGAQTFSTAYPGAFVDISPAGNALGTAIAGVGDDTLHNIVTTLGNPLFPAGNVRIGNNGFALSHGAGAVTTFATASLTNAAIPAVGLPTGVTAGTPAALGYLMPHWDDLDIPVASAAITLYWWEDLVNGILYIQWNNDGHFPDVAGQVTTFQLQVYNGAAPACVPAIQYAYLDTVFGGTQAAFDNGASATVGYVKGAGPAANAQWSFNTAGSVAAGMILSIIPGVYTLAATSPCGPGDLQLDFVGGPCGGTYILAVTLNAGAWPFGWLYGVDIPIQELAGEVGLGFPFVGPLNAVGNFTLGPFGCFALPSTLTFYAVGLAYPSGGSGAITAHTPAITYMIP